MLAHRFVEQRVAARRRKLLDAHADLVRATARARARARVRVRVRRQLLDAHADLHGEAAEEGLVLV